MMQRRLVEELQILDLNINLMKDAYQNIDFMLHRLLSSPDKSFEVTFKGKQYNFIYPTTPEERQQMQDLRSDLIGIILKECLVKMTLGEDIWWTVTAFASGIDTLDMQIEIVKEDIVNRVDENGERITALPLDMNNYQIEMQRPEIEYDKQDQALDL